MKLLRRRRKPLPHGGAPTAAHFQSTLVTFNLATKALEQGASTAFFRQLADSYDELFPENDYDLDIAIYPEEAED